jgi:hypothetical protein
MSLLRALTPAQHNMGKISHKPAGNTAHDQINKNQDSDQIENKLKRN